MLALLFCLLLPVTALAETQVITLTVVGDTLLGSNKKVSTETYAYQRYIEQNGYAYPFAQVLELTAKDDITLANLEGVLYSPEKVDGSRLIFNGPTDYAKILTEGSVEIVNLANNHTDDYGQAGYASTVEALKSEGIAYCGDTRFGRELYWFDFPNDVRIGFIGVIPMYYKDNVRKVEEDFQKLRDEGCDVIIASLHCGKEGSATHSSIQDKYRKICIENGAHIVVGHHPHVPQGLCVQDGVTQLYSLGNFTFGGNTGVDERLKPQGLMAQIRLYFEDGKYTGHQVILWPILISGTSPNNNYQPILATGEEAQAIMRRIQKDTKIKLNPFIDGQGAVQDYVPWPGK